MTSTGATIGPGAAPPANRTIIRPGGALDLATAATRQPGAQLTGGYRLR